MSRYTDLQLLRMYLLNLKKHNLAILELVASPTVQNI